MGDLIESLFSDGEAPDDPIGPNYPGSRHPRRTDFVRRARRGERGSDDWREDYTLRRIGGVERKMYTIGAVCTATGRPLITIRKWMRTGRIPFAPYRLPDRGSQKGPRLYSEPMIDALVDALCKRGLMDKARIEWTEHPDFVIEVGEAWTRIYQQETGTV